MSKTYSIHALLEMLREPCGEPDCGHCGLERQAADEIERLRAENADLLFTLRVNIGAVYAVTDKHRQTVSRAYQKARER